ncbi:ATP-dependent RNA helicase DDX51 [Tupaia chinensis]|uniref:ATP-dependent RNA helicase DDX51 n=1 Tax=Tupaia chinensis TaxID=246437 RepID=L9L0R6_TUPCH|nr:ATP-dependent RNA helicase DDX51 [Tupaia chinensis]
MTASSGGSGPTNSSPRSSKAPHSRLHVRTASWVSSGSSDCGQRPAPWLAEPRRVKKNVTADLVPIENIPEVHPDLQKQLRAHGISSYFPVQAAVIPVVLESAANGFLVGRGGYRPSDLCVSAPTGSGKTLAFVIPVVQVSKVFNVYTDATPLRVALLTGQKPLAKEQESLVQKTPDGYRCLADIVVATPGRLVDHIDQTPAFSLQQLRFLMPLQKLLFSATLTQNPEKLQQLGLYQPRLFTTGLPQRSPGDAGADVDGSSGGKYAFPAGLSPLGALALVLRKDFSRIICFTNSRENSHSLSSKPLVALHLVLRKDFSRILCFTNSRENSHRLFLLVRAFGGVNAAEFSSRLGPGCRKRLLKQFEQGKIQLLISTDATARGIDVPGVELVLNYDAPQYPRAYVHRVGRTARAGQTGQAFTLLLRVQERRFLQMLAEAGVPTLERHEIPGDVLQPLVPRYEEALTELEGTVREEQKQKVA